MLSELQILIPSSKNLDSLPGLKFHGLRVKPEKSLEICFFSVNIWRIVVASYYINDSVAKFFCVGTLFCRTNDY